ncbi:hypothetical protein ACJJTC_001144 [Scirpophaga incertulas]
MTASASSSATADKNGVVTQSNRASLVTAMFTSNSKYDCKSDVLLHRPLRSAAAVFIGAATQRRLRHHTSKRYCIKYSIFKSFCHSLFVRPPSSSLSYGAVNDDVRSPGSGGTPGPLSQPPPQTLDATDPGQQCSYWNVLCETWLRVAAGHTFSSTQLFSLLQRNYSFINQWAQRIINATHPTRCRTQQLTCPQKDLDTRDTSALPDSQFKSDSSSRHVTISPPSSPTKGIVEFEKRIGRQLAAFGCQR